MRSPLTSFQERPPILPSRLAWCGARMVNLMPASARISSVSRSDGGLGQPHAFRQASKAGFEVADAPAHLRFLVTAVGQRHDDVVIGLSDGRAVSGETLLAGTVGFENRRVDARGLVSIQESRVGPKLKLILA